MILKYKEFQIMELKTNSILNQNMLYDFEIIENGEPNFFSAKISEYGWSPHRHIIFYQFEIKDSVSENFKIGSEIILPLDFDGKEIEYIYVKHEKNPLSRADLNFQEKRKGKISLR